MAFMALFLFDIAFLERFTTRGQVAEFVGAMVGVGSRFLGGLNELKLLAEWAEWAELYYYLSLVWQA